MAVRVGFDSIMGVVSKKFGVSEDALVRSPMEEKARAAQAMAVYLAGKLIDMSDYAILRAFQISQVSDVQARVSMIKKDAEISEAKRKEIQTFIELVQIHARIKQQELSEENPEAAEKERRMEELLDRMFDMAEAAVVDGAAAQKMETLMAEMNALDPMPDLPDEEVQKKAQALIAEIERMNAMDYEKFYEYTSLEIERLKTQNVSGDYKLCKALAACYELQEHLANRIAEDVMRKGAQKHIILLFNKTV